MRAMFYRTLIFNKTYGFVKSKSLDFIAVCLIYHWSFSSLFLFLQWVDTVMKKTKRYRKCTLEGLTIFCAFSFYIFYIICPTEVPHSDNSSVLPGNMSLPVQRFFIDDQQRYISIDLLALHWSVTSTIDHHGQSMYSGHYTAFINCCKRTFDCNDSKITEFEMTDTKTPLLLMW